mmetsp:Transcript_13281/g.18112  ORF Transcript_13281/g.18112 Transcript_13281/m.18112 type:complete len:304 (+) Transcript_13281:94-1005(+)
MGGKEEKNRNETQELVTEKQILKEKGGETWMENFVYTLIESTFEMTFFYWILSVVPLSTAFQGFRLLGVTQTIFFAFYLYIGPTYGTRLGGRVSPFTLKCFSLCLFNILLTGMITYFSFCYVLRQIQLYGGTGYEGETEEEKEGKVSLFFSWCICFPFSVFCDEFWFYYLHRLAHHPSIYKYIHKYHHHFQMTHPVGAYYAHPLDQAFVVAAASVSGSVILATFVPSWIHYRAIFAWHLTGIFHFTQGHCGYAFPKLPRPLRHLLRSDDFHENHHIKFNYNYGNLIFLDQLHGTAYFNPPSDK